MKTISHAELDALRARPDAQWALFDIREQAEADAGHLYGASFLPRRLIELKLGGLVSDLHTTLVVYDEGGPSATRARRAQDTMSSLGHEDVRVLDGGVAAWKAEGRAVVSGSNVPSKLFGEHLYETHHVPRLPALDLRLWQQEGRDHLVLDIRTPEEYKAGRIPGARGAFGVDLALLADDLRHAGKPIIVHCAGRTRSIIACQALRELGVPDVQALENGTMGWQLQGFDIERGPASGVLQPSAGSVEASRHLAARLAEGVGVRWIDAGQLIGWQAERAAGRRNLYVVDVRQLDDYATGHIEGALALPGGLAVQRTDEFMAVKNATVVFVDDTEARAALTAFWFRRMGWPHIHVLRGGTVGWLQGGRALSTGRERSAPLGLAQAKTHVNPVDAASLAVALAREHPVPLVIDVDTSAAYESGHVPGARWVPYGSLEDRIDAELAARAGSAHDTNLVIVSRNGVLATFGAANLWRAGYRNVNVLDGGTDAWKKAGQSLDPDWPAGIRRQPDLVVPPYHSSLAEMARYLDWEQALTSQHAKEVDHGFA